MRVQGFSVNILESIGQSSTANTIFCYTSYAEIKLADAEKWTVHIKEFQKCLDMESPADINL